MPWKDPTSDIARLRRRCRDRNRIHSNWRQVYVDCAGQCINPLPEGGYCAKDEHLEFHENFGEDHNGDGRMQERVLLCPYHHGLHHPTNYNVEFNPKKSKLTEDVQMEIELAGGMEAWAEKYNLDLNRWGCKCPQEEQNVRHDQANDSG